MRDGWKNAKIWQARDGSLRTHPKGRPRKRTERPSGREARSRPWVLWHGATGRWQVRVKSAGETFHVGLFDCPVEAALARNAWLAKHLGGLAHAWAVRARNLRRRGSGQLPSAIGEAKQVTPLEPYAPEPLGPEDRAEAEADSILAELEAIERGEPEPPPAGPGALPR